MRNLEARFARTLLNEEDYATLKSEWQSIGWRLLKCVREDDVFFLLYEQKATKCGGGFYAFRPNCEHNLVLQAPHSFADHRTRDIGRRLFEGGSFRAAAWNTVHRNSADVAHTRIHSFNAFMQAVTATHPDALFIQLHGFAKQKRNTAAGVAADLIVSDGTRNPSRWVREATISLQSGFPDVNINLFPYDVRELGALRNVQAQLLRQLDRRRFLHLEMSAGLRQRLLASDAMQGEMLKELGKIYRFSKR